MTANEIKAAWNTFKKEAKKEISFDLNGCCYMNANQIRIGTATITLCNSCSYEENIAMITRAIEMVNGYEGWTAEEKKRSEDYDRECIRYIESLAEKYNDRENEAAVKYDEILNSNAFRKLAETIGINGSALEAKKGFYQMRISY